MSTEELLFYSRGDLSGLLREQQEHMKAEVSGYDADYLLNVSEADLEKHLYQKYSLEAPTLLEDSMYQEEPRDVDVSVPSPYRGQTRVRGTAITVVVPFSGDEKLFHYQPSHYTLNPPRGKVCSDRIEVTLEAHRSDRNTIRRDLDRLFDSIRSYVSWVASDVDQYNQALPNAIHRAVEHRKAKLLADRKLSESLGIPVVRRKDVPLTYRLSEIRRKPSLVRPGVKSRGPYEPEPELAQEEYEYILSIIRNMAQVMERSPRAFAQMNEEELRTQFLVPLNAHYEGQATGETFNFEGKTDILIRANGRNVFIAECKFWRGPQGLTDTIDQLLGYLSWRDTKAAILIFNRNRRFSSVLAKIHEVVREHPCYKRSQPPKGETEFRCVLHQPGDPNREITLTVLAFDVPQLDSNHQLDAL